MLSGGNSPPRREGASAAEARHPLGNVLAALGNTGQGRLRVVGRVEPEAELARHGQHATIRPLRGESQACVTLRVDGTTANAAVLRRRLLYRRYASPPRADSTHRAA